MTATILPYTGMWVVWVAFAGSVAWACREITRHHREAQR